jgi:hypothetical protein
MSTVTITDPTPTEQVPEIPVVLWRAYRNERRTGSKQRLAVTAAFERVPGFTKQDTRERLADALIEKEARDGLALTSREREDEIERGAAEVEDALAAPEPGSHEAIEADARQRVDELREQIARMSPEALVDHKVAGEQKAAESELAEAERALVNVTRARGEITRREESALEAAEREAVEQAEAEAAGYQPKIREAAERYDTAASTLAECAVAFRDLKDAQAGAISRTPRGAEGVRARSFKPGRLTEALAVALRARGVTIEGVTGSARDEPLAATEPEKL